MPIASNPRLNITAGIDPNPIGAIFHKYNQQISPSLITKYLVVYVCEVGSIVRKGKTAG